MSEPRAQPRLYTIPPSAPFLTTLARAILAGDLPTPGGMKPDRLSLPHTTIYLPTRRAARTLREAFLEESGGEALLLPRILALGHADEDAALILNAERFDDTDTNLGKPAIEPTARLIALMRMILAWSRGAGVAGPVGLQGRLPMTPAQAAGLAADLASLMDAADSEEADLSTLDTLVPKELAAHWAETVAFLTILTEQWPNFLHEVGLVSPVGRRNALMAQETKRLSCGARPIPLLPQAPRAPCRPPRGCCKPSLCFQTAPWSCRASI